jgi:antitoxin PrlF
MTTASKLSSKGQTTIPPAVRAALDLRKGDEIAYEIKENPVILTKASAGPVHDPFVTFDEWESEADREDAPTPPPVRRHALIGHPNASWQLAARPENVDRDATRKK